MPDRSRIPRPYAKFMSYLEITAEYLFKTQAPEIVVQPNWRQLGLYTAEIVRWQQFKNDILTIYNKGKLTKEDEDKLMEQQILFLEFIAPILDRIEQQRGTLPEVFKW
jgi:hypothetical protein